MAKLSWNVVFFPGTIFHELAHYLACVLVGVRVEKVKLFGLREAYVQHAMPNVWQSVVISIAPFILGNVVGFMLLLLARELLIAADVLSIIFYWLAVSLIFYSFPSRADALNAFDSVMQFYKEKLFKGNIVERLLWLILAPFVFFPLILLSGILIVFDYSGILKIIWLLAFVFISWGQGIPGMADLTHIFMPAQ